MKHLWAVHLAVTKHCRWFLWEEITNIDLVATQEGKKKIFETQQFSLYSSLQGGRESRMCKALNSFNKRNQGTEYERQHSPGLAVSDTSRRQYKHRSKAQQKGTIFFLYHFQTYQQYRFKRTLTNMSKRKAILSNKLEYNKRKMIKKEERDLWKLMYSNHPQGAWDLSTRHCFVSKQGAGVSPSLHWGKSMNKWIFYVNQRGKTHRWLIWICVSMCVCVRVKKRQRFIKRQRSSMKYSPHVHAVHQSLWLCVSLYLCLSHQLWNSIAYISNTRSCLFGRDSSSSMLKQFLLSCDRWWDSLISVTLCVKHLNWAFKARTLAK